MPTFVAIRPLAFLVAVVGILIASRSGAAPILGTYQAHGVIAEVSTDPSFQPWTYGLSIGDSVWLNFTLLDVPESDPGVYPLAVYSWNVVAEPRFYYSGGPTQFGVGSVQLDGDRFDLQAPNGLLSSHGTSTGGIPFEFSALGLSPGTGLRLPSSTATWEARVLDPNGNVLLRATSVPEPATNLLLGLSIAALTIGARRRLERGGSRTIAA